MQLTLFLSWIHHLAPFGKETCLSAKKVTFYVTVYAPLKGANSLAYALAYSARSATHCRKGSMRNGDGSRVVTMHLDIILAKGKRRPSRPKRHMTFQPSSGIVSCDHPVGRPSTSIEVKGAAKWLLNFP